MIDAVSIKAILEIYVKHGWALRRVLLSDGLKNNLGGQAAKDLFGDTLVKTSPLDALWFSRPSKGNMVAWELRHLSNVPYALLEGLDAGSNEAAFEETLSQTEAKMQNALRRKN